MFGPSLMVCPICEFEQRSRNVYFPDNFYDFYSESFIGKGMKEVEAPYERIPVFAREGSIVVFGDLIQSTKETQKDLTIVIYSGKNCSFDIYEDDGISYGYENNESSLIHLEFSNYTLKIGSIQGTFPGMLKKRNFILKLVTPSGSFIKTVKYFGSELNVDFGVENQQNNFSPWVKVLLLIALICLICIIVYLILTNSSGQSYIPKRSDEISLLSAMLADVNLK